jgi:hypothetical protein
METTNIRGADSVFLGWVGRCFYNNFQKKAMEQEFSWSGLVLSLSIAFFVVVFSVLSLNLVYRASYQARHQRQLNSYLENKAPLRPAKLLPVEISGRHLPRFESLNLA